MGGELLSDSPPLNWSGSTSTPDSVSYYEQFYNYLPFYLAIGVSYDQYWNGDCCLVKYYRQAYELKKRERNQELWMQGMYIYEVLCKVAPIFHPFAKKGVKPAPYVSEPYPLSHKEIVERNEREEKVRMDRIKTNMMSWAKETNSRFDKK